MFPKSIPIIVCAFAASTDAGLLASRLQPTTQQPSVTQSPGAVVPPDGAPAGLPSEYVIGAEDVLSINFWRDADMTRDEVTVRPDGRITLPLLGDVTAAGLTPEQLKAAIETGAGKYQKDPSVTVGVRQINSRKVFITGNVATPGTHPLTGPRTVMQLIALAGGLTEYADKKNIRVMRMEPAGEMRSFKFNYSDVAKGKSLTQNILLKPGDTVVVP